MRGEKNFLAVPINNTLKTLVELRALTQKNYCLNHSKMAFKP